VNRFSNRYVHIHPEFKEEGESFPSFWESRKKRSVSCDWKSKLSFFISFAVEVYLNFLCETGRGKGGKAMPVRSVKIFSFGIF